MKSKIFEEWLWKNYEDIRMSCYEGEWCTENSIVVIGQFDKLPFSMQWGVYLEFFDSVDLFVDLKLSGKTGSKGDRTLLFNPIIIIKDKVHEVELSKPRKEAQQEAIKQAFEILMLNELSAKGVQAAKAGEDLRNIFIA